MAVPPAHPEPQQSHSEASLSPLELPGAHTPFLSLGFQIAILGPPAQRHLPANRSHLHPRLTLGKE